MERAAAVERALVAFSADVRRVFVAALGEVRAGTGSKSAYEANSKFEGFEGSFASLHDFYNLSMVMDCLPASIVIYKHTYKEMFNDPSQVMYFHQPTYKRPRHLDFANIVSMSARDVNVLPIISQLKPDVPVLFEHTGACNSSSCSAAPWSWLVIHRHVLLCDNNGKYYVAKNIYVLFAYLMSKCED